MGTDNASRHRGAQRSYQQGLSLTGVSIALALAGLAASWGLWALAQGAERDKAALQGAQLRMLGNALGDYVKGNYVALAANTGVAGFANATQPTVAELRAAGLLDPGFSTTSLYNTGYTLRVTRTAGCALGPSTPSCVVTGLTALNAPLMYRGAVAWASLGEALAEMGANGGFSAQATPALISGGEGAWTVANPVGAAGVLAYRTTYGQADSDIVRRDGAFPMTGALRMGGWDIRGGGGGLLTEGGSVQTSGGGVQTGGGRVQTSGGSVLAGVGSISGGALSSSTAAFTGPATGARFSAAGTISGGPLYGSSLTVTGSASAGAVSASTVSAPTINAGTLNGPTISATSVSASGALQGGSVTVQSAGAVQLAGGPIRGVGVASVGGGCSPSGALAVSGSGELLSCRSGQWRKQSKELDGGLIIDKIASPGGGCSPNGALARTSAGMLLSCSSGSWAETAPSVPSGTECGATDWVENGTEYRYVLCDGHNPRNSCPAGFYSRLWGSARSHWFYTCVKS